MSPTKSSKPIVIEINVQTGETIEREMTDAEYAGWLAQQEADNANATT